MNDDPKLTFADASLWARWLATNHASSKGVWLAIAKEGASHVTVTYAEALDEALVEAGRMEAPGLAEVERAKADGRWDMAYDSPKNATVPEDLAAALAESPQAKSFFAKVDGANRYAVLYRVQTAKKPETQMAMPSCGLFGVSR